MAGSNPLPAEHESENSMTDTTQAYSIDHTKGSSDGTVSAQWASRSDDERFTDLNSLKAQVSAWRAASYTNEIPAHKIVARGDLKNPKLLTIEANGLELTPSHFGFSQLAGIAQAPADYLRSIPAPLAAVNINYGLQHNAPIYEKTHVGCRCAVVVTGDGKPDVVVTAFGIEN